MKTPIRKAVILAGGLGMRLQPLTHIIPKPLLPIGESTILEIQILALKKHGVNEIYIASNYMSDYLTSIVGNGQKYGVNILVSEEKERLGTCGPISLLRKELTEPFYMMNGDILTNIDFTSVGDFSINNEADLTVVTKEINIPFRFGKVLAEDDYIIDIEEKPNYKQEILAGIYVLKPSVIDMIPVNSYFGIDQLIKNMLAENKLVAKYLTHDYWIDIGQMEDYEMAKDNFPTQQDASNKA